MRRALGALMLAASLLAGCAGQPVARSDPTPLVVYVAPAPAPTPVTCAFVAVGPTFTASFYLPDVTTASRCAAAFAVFSESYGPGGNVAISFYPPVGPRVCTYPDLTYGRIEVHGEDAAGPAICAQLGVLPSPTHAPTPTPKPNPTTACVVVVSTQEGDVTFHLLDQNTEVSCGDAADALAANAATSKDGAKVGARVSVTSVIPRGPSLCAPRSPRFGVIEVFGGNLARGFCVQFGG